MRNLIVVIVGGLAAWIWGDSVAVWLFDQLGGGSYGFMRLMGWILAFFAGGIAAQTVLALRQKTGGGSGGWAIVLRPVTGTAMEWAVMAAVGFAVLVPVVIIINRYVPYSTEEGRERAMTIGLLFVTIVAIWLMEGPNQIRVYRLIAGAFAPFRRMLRIAGFGKGGSAAFAGLLSEWKNLRQPGSVLLGSSLYGKHWKIGFKDDRHLLTIAATGGGKGRSAIIPNLLMWPGSALVIDPKGTNALVTAARRGHGGGRVTEWLGQEVHVFDPFNVVTKRLGIESASYNPLAQLDPKSERIVEDIWAIADGLVVPETKNPHWDESAHGVISGVIAHVITTEKPEKRTLGRVREILTDKYFLYAPEDESGGMSIIAQMMGNKHAELARGAASQIVSAGDQERGSIISSALRHTKWLDSAPMRRVVSGSGFNLRDLKRKNMTVYVVIPPEELPNHKRFLRLFVTTGMAAMLRETARPKHRVLFIIDEFAALGRMQTVYEYINIVRDFGILIWPIIQNIGQIWSLYGQDWDSFHASTGAIQIFSVGGKSTADFVADDLGERRVNRKAQGQIFAEMARLRTPGEVREQTARDSGTQIVIRNGERPFLLRRLLYDKDFKRHQFSPDPGHREPPTWLEWIGKAVGFGAADGRASQRPAE